VNRMSKDEPKVKTLYIKPGELWGSTLYCGPVVVRFMTGKRGRRCKVEYCGKGKPRHRRVKP
jgi:hypothetical protein